MSASILGWPPLESEGLGYLMPASAGMAATMIGAHTRALTVMSLSIPAGRRALLLLLIELDNVDLTVAL
jgi:hypothetical protein